MLWEPSTEQEAQAALHFAHLQPTHTMTADTPTSTYTIASSVGIEPSIACTTFQFLPPSNIPTPTKPQFKPPIHNKVPATLDIKQPPHLEPQLPCII